MLEKLFGFNPKETTIRTEIMAGITTFLTMAYILAVNPNILGETGMDKGLRGSHGKAYQPHQAELRDSLFQPR